MKWNVVLIVAALIMSAGCDPTGPLPDASPSGEVAYVNLSLDLQSGPPYTRALTDVSALGGDGSIKDGVILEFDPEGLLLEMIHFSGSVPPKIRVRRHQQTEIYIVANPTVDLSGIASLTDFLSMESDYKANTLDRMEMTGHLKDTFSSDAVVNIQMKRMLSKIQVDDMTFKSTPGWPDYTGIHFTRAYLEKTPVTCAYDFSLPGGFIDAYDKRVSIGYTSNYSSSVHQYTQGGTKVWEYETPWAVYCYPNASDNQNERNVLAVSYRLVYLVTGVDGMTGEPVVQPRYEDACVHLVLPPLLPNTLYELERLTLNGARYKTVYLSTRSADDELSECSFRMTDMTSGEYLGSVQGEVEYEIQDH